MVNDKGDNTAVRLPGWMRTALDELVEEDIAAGGNANRSHFIRIAVLQYLESKGRREPKKKGRG